jgi:hypothetical protein
VTLSLIVAKRYPVEVAGAPKSSCSPVANLSAFSSKAAPQITTPKYHTMPPKYHVGQRVSFASHLGTVRYIGPVDGYPDDIEFLGVEWDNASRGKHNGTYKGRLYFKCEPRYPIICINED